jgi:hypothetical protein
MSLQIRRPVRTPAFSLSWITAQYFWLMYLKQFQPMSRAHTNCINEPSFTCKGGSNTLAWPTSGSCSTFFNRGVKDFVGGQLCLSQCSLFAQLAYSHKKQGILVQPVCRPSNKPITLKSLHTCHPCTL